MGGKKDNIQIFDKTNVLMIVSTENDVQYRDYTMLL